MDVFGLLLPIIIELEIVYDFSNILNEYKSKTIIKVQVSQFILFIPVLYPSPRAHSEDQ